MSAFFIAEKYNNSSINTITDFRRSILDEFGYYVSSTVNVYFDKNTNSNIYGFICEIEYIKNIYKNIVNTNKLAKISGKEKFIMIKSLTKEVYESMFSIKDTNYVYFALKFDKRSNFFHYIYDDLDENYINNIFSENVATTLKYGEYDIDNYCMSIKCHINYIKCEFRNIVNTDDYIELLPIQFYYNDNGLKLVAVSTTEEKYNLLGDKDSMLQMVLDRKKRARIN